MTTLAKMLEAKEPLFDFALKQLEERTDKQGVDAQLAAEIASTVAAKSRELGLEPDCTGPELYLALIKLVHEHDDHLARAIGGTNPSSLAEMLPLVVAATKRADIPRDGYFLRHEVAQQMLTQMPPKQVMARLGYTDVETMLARENLYEIFLALRFAEEADWLNQFNRLYHTLTAADFETRQIELVQFDPEKWGDIAAKFIQNKLHNITNSKEIGAIAIMPMTITEMPGITLKVMPLIFHYYNEIRLYSSFFKLMSRKRNFGEIVSSTLIADPSHTSVTKGHSIHWRVIQRYFGKHPAGHSEIFEPHLQPEDLHWRKAEAVLYDIDPELGFWRDLDFVGVLKGNDVVAFNLMDVSLSYSNQLSYADRYIYHFRESLWNEIFARYFGQKTLEEQLLVKLDNDLIAPEELKV